MIHRASAPELPANDNQPPNSMEPFNRHDAESAKQVLRSVEDYCFELGKPACHAEIPTVLVLRELQLSMESAAFELKAMRSLCRLLLAGRKSAPAIKETVKPAACIPSRLNAPEWFENTSWQAIQDLSDRLASVSLAELLGCWLAPADASLADSEFGNSTLAPTAPIRKRLSIEEAKFASRAVPARKAS